MTTLDVIATAFVEMAHRIVWCVAATTDGAGDPSTRVLHPFWEWDGERLVGWILTSPLSPKAAHLAANPNMSVTYWTASHDTCTAAAPAPVGYDPRVVPMWTSPSVPEFGVLQLTPTSLRVMPGAVMLEGRPELLLTWRA
jgi:hypothetical protein